MFSAAYLQQFISIKPVSVCTFEDVIHNGCWKGIAALNFHGFEWCACTCAEFKPNPFFCFACQNFDGGESACVDQAVHTAEHVRFCDGGFGADVDACSSKLEILAIHAANVNVADVLLQPATSRDVSARVTTSPMD
jgi:hypothetical protein